MNVALLSDCYLPRLGGIEVQLHDLAASLQAGGHRVEVFCATPGADRAGVLAREYPGPQDVDGVPVHRLATRLPFDLPVNPLAPPGLRRRLVAGGFDVAHVHTGVVSPFAVDATRVCLGLGLPTAMTWHCMLAHTVPLFRAAGYGRRWARAGVAMNAVSGMAARAVQLVVGSAGRVGVLPNGIDVTRWVPGADAGTRPAASEVRLVTAMRLAARKRPMALLRLMVGLRESLPAGTDVRLEILGEGPMRPRLERFVRRHGLEATVRLPGRVTRGELRERYLASDIYLSPARLESFGIAALEARTVGLPVVGRTSSGLGEFVRTEVDGLLAPDDDGFAAAVARLVRDAALRERIAAHNIAVPPEQDWSRVGALALAEYDRAIRLAGR